MAGKRNRAEGKSNSSEAIASKDTGRYELLREERIRANKERMHSLGILDLSIKLKSELIGRKRVSRKVSSEKKTHLQFPISEPPRRSSRLKSMNPVCYSEICTRSNKGSSKNGEICLKEGSQPEIYTEEHEKLLGDCKASWTLLVDGYGQDGKRIYDQVKGETCHQCRQKTLGHHTHCSRCKLVQGQLCGDCLYMRYGENVIEANQNPSWLCPVCRGICNCSFCRQAKGWAPTGNLYRKVARLGYKSVAHYLIQTRRPQANSEDLLPSNDKGPSYTKQNESLDADKNTDEPQLEDHEDKSEVEDSKHVDIHGKCDREEDDNDATSCDTKLDKER